MFDHLDDDEYDGELGENDDELPRIHFGFKVNSQIIGKHVDSDYDMQTKSHENIVFREEVKHIGNKQKETN